MNKYIISKSGLALIEGLTVISEFKRVPYVIVELTQEQVEFLTSKEINVQECKEEGTPLITNVTSLGGDYEKFWSNHHIAIKRGITGAGCIVAVLDDGCAINHVPVDFAYNVIDGTNVITPASNHGTAVTSVVRSSIGLAPDCQLWHFKVNTGSVISSNYALALDYMLDNDMIPDVVVTAVSAGLPEVFYELVQQLTDLGTIFLGATGNLTSVSSMASPAIMKNFVAINGVRKDRTPKQVQVGFDPNPSFPDLHGVDFACNGTACQVIFNNGSIVNTNGTSFSTPWFAGAFALYKQVYKEYLPNPEILEVMKKDAFKRTDAVSITYNWEPPYTYGPFLVFNRFINFTNLKLKPSNPT